MIAQVGTPERRRQDKEMIESPGRWPMWPMLPLKKVGSQYAELPMKERTGLITPDFPNIVIHEIIFRVNVNLVIHQLQHDGDVEGIKTTKYQDIDAMLDDGWTVD
jgi:hypothetical protein